MAKKHKEESKEEEKLEGGTFVVSDPERADRKLELGGMHLELESGKLNTTAELTAEQLGELKAKYPYLLVERA